MTAIRMFVAREGSPRHSRIKKYSQLRLRGAHECPLLVLPGKSVQSRKISRKPCVQIVHIAPSESFQITVAIKTGNCAYERSDAR